MFIQHRAELIIVLILMISLGSTLQATIDCPDELMYEEEGVCEVTVTDANDVYDVKIYLVGDDGGVNRIWDGEAFRRSDWYVTDVIDRDGDFEFPIFIYKAFDGEATGQFKLRDSTDHIVLSKTFSMTITSEQTQTDEDEDEETFEVVQTQNDSEETQKTNTEENIQNDTPQEYVQMSVSTRKSEDESISKDTSNEIHLSKNVINLGIYEVEEEEEETTVYVSKQERVKDYALYGFVVFLIVIIGFLLYERR